MNNHKRNITLVVADTQFLTNEALKSILSPLYQVVHLVSTKAGLLQYLHQETISLVITDHTLFDFDSVNDLGEIRKE